LNKQFSWGYFLSLLGVVGLIIKCIGLEGITTYDSIFFLYRSTHLDSCRYFLERKSERVLASYFINSISKSKFERTACSMTTTYFEIIF
jgi:hypothetical protein